MNGNQQEKHAMTAPRNYDAMGILFRFHAFLGGKREPEAV